MRAWGLAALIALVALVAGCGGNSTPVAVTITSTTTGATTNSITILESTSAQFVATVTGASSNVVFWQVCMPFTPTAQNPSPTNCTQGVGVTQCTNIPTVKTPLTGFGTITINGLYTAPPAPTTPDTFLIVATSCVDSTKFGTFNISIDSGIRVKIVPDSATVGESETYQFSANVTGTQNTAVSWQVCTSGASGALTNCAATGNPGGNISPSGLFTAPTSTQSATIEAISAADQNQTATATVSTVAETAPTLSTTPTTPPILPTTAAQGSVQQDVYLTGTGFISTTNVVVEIPPSNNVVILPTSDFVLLGGSLIRVTIPGSFLTNAGPIQVGVQDQKGNPPSTTTLNIVAVRPAMVADTPESVPQSSASSPTVLLTGGFFTPSATTATFNGQPIAATVTSSRQISLAIASGNLSVPGLYPIAVQNAGLPVGTPSLAALNLGVTPVAANIGGSATNPPIGVGSGPSAVAIDEADGLALVANTNSNSVSIINLATSHVTQVTAGIGNKPTGIAVDDLLSSPVALVVNSADQTVSAIDIRAGVTFGAPLNVGLGPATPPILPFSIGINPVTHRAIVAYQSTNQATVLDLSTGSPTVVEQIAGTATTSFGTGTNPAIAVDPQLNWALVTPGGSGAVNIVDLGVTENAVTGWSTSRAPRVVANISISTTAQGVGLDTETHEAFVSDPQGGTLTTFSLLDFTVTSVMQGAAIFNTKGFGAAAVNSLDSIGVSVSGSTPGASAVVVNLENGTVLQTIGGFAGNSNLTAVAVDPITNEAVAVDQANGTAYMIPLGPSLKPLQITEASHPIIFGGPDPAGVTITINGSGFVAGSQVLLDGSALPAGDVSFLSSRELIANIPGGNGSLLTQPRRFALQIGNPDGSVSNVTGIGVVQAVPVGTSPVGVAIDTDRDLAIVTNSVDGTVSLVALTTQTPVGTTQTPAGAIGVITGASAITVGTTPEGVASLPRFGLALVANNGSNNATIVDVTQTKSPQAVNLCGSGCTGPVGVTMDQDTATGYIADSNVTNDPTSLGIVSTVDMTSGAASTTDSIDHNPVDVAVDPNPFFPYLAVATDSSDSIIDFLDTTTGGSLIGRTSGLSNPTGIIFDPVNQIFLVTDSTLNEISLIDPTTFLATPVRVGIGPTSLDYNYQASTLVTANTVSGTMSVLSYICPPSPAAPACLGPQVSTVIGIGGNQTTAPALGAASIAVDPILNLAVLVDEDNNQVLLVPLPD